MARKTAAETAKTRQRILDAAAEMFANQGVSDTTLDQVARKAGMTRGAVYWHFKDKQDLLRTVLAEQAHPLELELSPNSSLESAWSRVQAALVHSITQQGSRQLSEILIYQGLDETGEIQLRLVKARTRFIQYLCSVLENAMARGELTADLDVETVTEIFKVSVTGLLYESLKCPEHNTQNIQATLQALLYLLKHPPPHLLRACPQRAN